MLARFDERSPASADERMQHCSFCGKALVLLPNDRRGGACFDCLALWEGFDVPCPACGALIEHPDPDRACSRCGAAMGSR